MTTVKELVAIQIGAEGPCTFRTISRYVREQYTGGVVFDWMIAAALTELIREEKAALYEDGCSFDTVGQR